MKEKHINFPVVLFFIFVGTWVLLAINPLYRFDWFLENIVVFLFTPLVVLSYFKFRLSNRAYFLIFVFGMLHIAAAHYTYGDTPWGDWLSSFFGWERNHYDRIVHFLYGVLMTVVFMEFVERWTSLQGFLRGLFIFALVVATGALYEVAEFIVGVTAEPGKGLGFLGFQGDVWDTQKDMFLQSLGALATLCAMSLFSRWK